MKPIRSKLLSALQLLFLLSLALSILRDPAGACAHAALALQLWFEKMIPSLFPFMILSGMILRMDFAELVSLPVYPFLGRLYRMNKTMCTTMLMGFLFGFPLGAKTVAEAYELGKLSRPQAQYLLSFCNNIGPVYLLSFALPLLGLSGQDTSALQLAVIAVFFGIPLLYGLGLRYTVYRSDSFSGDTVSARLHASRKPVCPDTAPAGSAAFIPALDASVTSACSAITRLGGYMIFFIVCSLLLKQAAAIAKTPAAGAVLTKLSLAAAPALEITSGLSLAKGILSPALFMTLLTFGGLSCFAQTYTCIRNTDLSFAGYCFHKILQSIIAFCFYTLLFSAFSGKMPLLS